MLSFCLQVLLARKRVFFMAQRTESKQVFFKFFDDYAENYLEFMTGDQVKDLMLALVYYHRDCIVPNFSDPLLSMAFKVISGNIDRDKADYLARCEQNRQNALARQESIRKLKEKVYGDDYEF